MQTHQWSEGEGRPRDLSRSRRVYRKGLGLDLGLLGAILLSTLLSTLLPGQLRAEEAHFERRELSPGFSPEDGAVAGYTGGSYSLAVIRNRDRNNTPCLGYGDSRPDHILVLSSDFPTLSLRLDSGGEDTTLLVEGPDGVRCGEDQSAVNLDDQVSGEQWKAGRYSIWVGTMEPRNRLNYRLLVTEELPQ